MKRANSMGVVFASALLSIAGLASAETFSQASMIAYEAAQQSCAEQGSFMVAAAEKEQAPSGDVQERAVPRARVPGAAMPKVEGAVVKGNRLQALPGFVLQQGPNNQVMVRRAGGSPGGLGATTVTCGCDDQTGTCTLYVTGGTALCEKASGNTCTGSCVFTTITTGLGGKHIQ